LKKAATFKCEHHLVNRRRRHPKEALHLSLGGRPAVNQRVRTDEGEILPLKGRERRSVMGVGSVARQFVRSCSRNGLAGMSLRCDKGCVRLHRCV
jgi:hypothetical protein